MSTHNLNALIFIIRFRGKGLTQTEKNGWANVSELPPTLSLSKKGLPPVEIVKKLFANSFPNFGFQESFSDALQIKVIYTSILFQ